MPKLKPNTEELMNSVLKFSFADVCLHQPGAYVTHLLKEALPTGVFTAAHPEIPPRPRQVQYLCAGI